MNNMEENLENLTEKEHEMNESIEEPIVNTAEAEQKPESKPVVEETPASCEKKCCGAAHWIVEGVLAAAVIALFILHFAGGNKKAPVVQKPVEKGNGETVFINIDSINANYELVDILTKDIEAEMSKQEAVFQNRQAALERKAAQFQQNYQAGILTQVQIENAQQQLMQESETLKEDYARVMGDLEARQAAALKQIADSVINATKLINAERNASYVFSYQYGGQLIDADPSKDVTNELLEILNEPFKSKKK